MFTRRRMVRLGAGAVALGPVALAACGAPNEAATTAQRSQQPVTLRYAGPFTPSPSNIFANGVNQIIDAYNARGTNVTVKWEEPKPLAEGILAQVAGGDAPDLVHSHPRDYLPYADAVLELDSLMKRDKKVIPDILPTVLDYWVRHGQPGNPHTGMPNNMSIQSIYFNKALFEKNGLKTPDQLEKEGKWNWETYLDSARRITTGQGDNRIWGAPWTNTTLDIQLGYIWPMGGNLWDKEVKSTLLDTRDSLEAIQFQADLTSKYQVSPDAEEQKILPRATGGALAIERGGMEVLTNDVVGLLAPTSFPKGVAPLPKGKAGRVVRGIAVGLGITKDSKHQEAAWDYALFQSGPDGEKVMLGLSQTLPWRKSSAESADFAKSLQPWESVAVYNEGLRGLRPTIYPVKFNDIRKLYGNAYSEVRAGKQTAAQAIAAIKGQINDLLRS
ncbi:MAG TPA: extracellular solute-binding protein [Chloroflexota bacterium]|nr:extracellular solute-binding protein [Chloroflexota bacterium]